MAFAIITPPFQAPDEIVHFYRAYQISEFHLMPEKVGDGYGAYLPESIPIAATKAGQGIQQNSNIRYNTTATFDLLRQPLNAPLTTPLKFVNSYSPVAYLFQLPGIFLGRIFNLPPILILYLGRIFSVIFWSIALFIAIRISPIGKWSMVALGLTPMAVFLSGSVTIDTILNASAFLLLAFSFRARNNNSISRKDIIIIGALFLVIALTKIIYLPIVAVLFIVTSKSFIGLRRTIIFLILAVVVSIALGYGWMRITTQAQTVAVQETSSLVGFGIVPKQQLDYILANPAAYFRTTWNTYLTNNGNHITSEYYGTLGSLDVSLPQWLTMAGYIIIILALISEPKTIIHFSLRYKFLLISSFVFIVAAISTAMYLYSSPYKYVIIVGLQGRYFIPATVLAIPLVMNSFKGVKFTPEARRLLVVRGSVVVLILALFIESFRYYAILGTIIDKTFS